jgi:hypothetical protein
MAEETEFAMGAGLGRKDEILASLRLLDESMAERRRARRPAAETSTDTSAGQQ